MATLEVRIKLRSDRMEDSDVQELLFQLANDLAGVDGAEAKMNEGYEVPPGSKGDPLSIGEIMMKVLSGGGVVAGLVGVLRVYAHRVPTLELELKNGRGQSMKLRAKNFSEESLKTTIKQLQTFFE